MTFIIIAVSVGLLAIIVKNTQRTNQASHPEGRVKPDPESAKNTQVIQPETPNIDNEKKTSPAKPEKPKVDQELFELRNKAKESKNHYLKTQERYVFLKDALRKLPVPELNSVSEYMNVHKEIFNNQDLDILVNFQKVDEYLMNQWENIQSLIIIWERRELLFDKPNEELFGQIDPSDRDDLFEEAARWVVSTQLGSTSAIQRKLNLEYARVGKIVDQLEDAGILGSFNGSKGRKVLVPNEEELELKLGLSANSKRPVNRQQKLNRLKIEISKKPVFKNESSKVIVTERQLEKEYEAFVERFQMLNKVAALGILMAESLRKEDRLLYSKLYNSLDKLGMFESNWEKKIDQELLKVNDNLESLSISIDRLMDTIQGMENNITTAINDLSWEMSDAFSNMETSMDEKIDNVKSDVSNMEASIGEKFKEVQSDIRAVGGAVGIGNMLTAYNTYQLRSIKKRMN